MKIIKQRSLYPQVGRYLPFIWGLVGILLLLSLFSLWSYQMSVMESDISSLSLTSAGELVMQHSSVNTVGMYISIIAVLLALVVSVTAFIIFKKYGQDYQLTMEMEGYI